MSHQNQNGRRWAGIDIAIQEYCEQLQSPAVVDPTEEEKQNLVRWAKYTARLNPLTPDPLPPDLQGELDLRLRRIWFGEMVD
jgi:hypothetical protein